MSHPVALSKMSLKYLGDAVAATDARFHQVTCWATFFLQRHHVTDGLAQRQMKVFC